MKKPQVNPHTLENELIEAFGIQDKDKLRDIISKYDIAAKDKDGGKDLKEKINMYLSDLRMEGLSQRTIDAYKLQLKHFTNYVQKPVEKITTQDIKIYLSQYSHLAANTINSVP